MTSYFVILLFAVVSLTTAQGTYSVQSCLNTAINSCLLTSEIPLPAARRSQSVPGKRGPPGPTGSRGAKGEPGSPCDVEDQMAALLEKLSNLESEQNSMKEKLVQQSTELNSLQSQLNTTEQNLIQEKTEFSNKLYSLESQLNTTEQNLIQEISDRAIEARKYELRLNTTEQNLIQEKTDREIEAREYELRLNTTEQNLIQEKTDRAIEAREYELRLNTTEQNLIQEKTDREVLELRINRTEQNLIEEISELNTGVSTLTGRINITETNLMQETSELNNEISNLALLLNSTTQNLVQETAEFQNHILNISGIIATNAEALNDTSKQVADIQAEFQNHILNISGIIATNAEALNDTSKQVADIQAADNIMTSCLDWKNAGKNQNGIYQIQPSNTSSILQVYCDQQVNGGGWTLVASVHENNIDGKCTIGDNWSNDQGTTGTTSSSSWSDTRIFGNVEGATSDDYKNEAYFNLPASDIMIWHVPNNLQSSQWAEQSTLKYFTTVGILYPYGGTLRDLYKNNFPMERQEKLLPAIDLASYITKFEEQSSYIRSGVSSFYEYTYDNTANNRIADGGRDMYDDGNRVYIRTASNSNWHQVVYNEIHNDNGWSVSSTARVHPFLALMHIENPEGRESYFELKVESDVGADNTGSYSSYSGDLSYDSYYMKYKTYNVYGAGGDDPSICEVYFVVYSTKMGSVVTGSDFFTSNYWSTGTEDLINSMRVTNNPRNVILGYTLLSKSDQTIVSSSETRNALTNLLQRVIAERNCSRIEESAVAPVTFHSGSEQNVTNKIPEEQRNHTTAGYLQLRALNYEGFPYAMCPGVRTESCKPSTFCIGSIGMSGRNSESCGDFTDGTSPFHNPKNSILIFTKN